ncbi:M1 family metallopeptidase [Fulvivirgaceae bacterium BMA10]|uniref:M1 family metallopeptidase n=1 Tax=Splendidivirga corallicola TaxID=3051826 RepID=A0ABT8L0W5_9BACT|nr:M1 family metallopeptidase [Fulvivirgaceae bacterium BMA10]
MKKVFVLFLVMISIQGLNAQEKKHEGKFEQLGTQLPTPNTYRTGSGAPGRDYWQQKADYVIDVELDDQTQTINGSETITYTNNSPDVLTYLWVQLDQNVRAKDSSSPKIRSSRIYRDSIPAKAFQSYTIGETGYEGGYNIKAVKDQNNKALPHLINKTMMRVELPQAMNTGDQFTFSIDWSYKVYDRMMEDGRGGYEYFPEDGNYSYSCAQWFPRMCVYDDVNGWQNKQFLGRGEFALPFGDYKVKLTVPADHIVAATGELQNAKNVLTSDQYKRFQKAKKTFDKPVLIVTQDEAKKKEKKPNYKKKSTWEFHAKNVRDFAFATSRKFIWDAMAVKLDNSAPLAMSFYPKEGNPLWEKESTVAVKNTLEVYSERTFEYPYPVAISVHAANQGMEYPMICFNYGRPKEDGTYSDRLRDGMISVIVHEVGHNYFPMIVNSDERQWTWMDEGLNTFLERETKRIRYSDLSLNWGSPKGIVPYMKGDKKYIRPIMTNSENIRQFGYNAYAKPSAALTVLRETVMGPELFDHAFKEYAQRWAFKHPKPADFFRTMEDASAVDLDWFWKGWFYSTDHVDVALDNVKWFRLKNEKPGLENKIKSTQIAGSGGSEEKGSETNSDFSNGYEEIVLTDTDPRFYGEYKNRVDDEAIRRGYADKNFYELSFKNNGGIPTPLIIEWEYKDGTKEVEKIPAEIWRMNESETKKVFAKDKEVVNIVLDPYLETADTNTEDNVFPKKEEKSKFDKFKEKAGE